MFLLDIMFSLFSYISDITLYSLLPSNILARGMFVFQQKLWLTNVQHTTADQINACFCATGKGLLKQ